MDRAILCPSPADICQHMSESLQEMQVMVDLFTGDASLTPNLSIIPKDQYKNICHGQDSGLLLT